MSESDCFHSVECLFKVDLNNENWTLQYIEFKHQFIVYIFNYRISKYPEREFTENLIGSINTLQSNNEIQNIIFLDVFNICCKLVGSAMQ